MHGINLAHQLIVAVTIEDMMARSSRLLHVGHIIVLNEVDNFHNLSKIVSCVFSETQETFHARD